MASSGSPRIAWLAGLERYSDTTNTCQAKKLVELLHEACHFEVTQANATEDRLCDDLYAWLHRSLVALQGRSEAVLLLYFSGRAFECNGQTFVVPWTSTPTQLASDAVKLVCVSEIIQQVYDGACQHMSPSRNDVEPKLFLLILLDCPRESAEWCSAAQKYRPAESGAASSSGVDVDVEVCIVNAMGEHEEEQFGLFLGACVDALEQPGVKWRAFWDACRAKCVAESEQQQCPWKYESVEHMDKLVLHDGGAYHEPLHARDWTNVATCKCLQELEKLHFSSCWSGVLRTNIARAIRAGKMYAEVHAEVGDVEWKFPPSSWCGALFRSHTWGPACYLALFDRWVFFDESGASSRYSVGLVTRTPKLEESAFVEAREQSPALLETLNRHQELQEHQQDADAFETKKVSFDNTQCWKLLSMHLASCENPFIQVALLAAITHIKKEQHTTVFEVLCKIPRKMSHSSDKPDWGNKCYVALLDNTSGNWLFFDDSGTTNLYTVPVKELEAKLEGAVPVSSRMLMRRMHKPRKHRHKFIVRRRKVGHCHAMPCSIRSSGAALQEQHRWELFKKRTEACDVTSVGDMSNLSERLSEFDDSMASACSVGMPAASCARPRIAWLIGQQSYDHYDRLPGVDDNVERLERRLRKFGFTVNVVRNVNKENFDALSGDFVRSLSDQPNSVFLLYYAGHGLWCRGQMMLVPVDAKHDHPRTWVNLKALLQPVHDISGTPGNHRKKTAEAFGAEPAPGTQILVVLDCSRREPNIQRNPGRAIMDELEEVTRAPITTTRRWHACATELSIFYACDENRDAYEDEKRELGIFTLAFLRGLGKPGLSWDQVFQWSRDECLRLASKAHTCQRPWVYGSTGRKLVLHEENIQLSDDDINSDEEESA